jgi:hypothetical protein
MTSDFSLFRKKNKIKRCVFVVVYSGYTLSFDGALWVAVYRPKGGGIAYRNI